MDLTGQQIKNTYGNVVTVGSIAGAPTIGELTNGRNTSFTSTYLSGNFGVGDAPSLYASLNTLGIGSSGSANGGIIDIIGTSGRLASIYTESSGKIVFASDPTNAQASSALEFNVDGSNAMFINSSGNVGIGTTSPSQTFHVSGSARITGAIYDSNNVAGTSGQILSSTGTGTDWVTLSEISGVDGTGTANYVSKWSDTDTIANSQIQDDGTTVAIGQAPDATAKLAVDGAIKTEAAQTSTAADWKLGNVGLGGVFVGVADYVTISVGGLVVKLPIAIFPETQDYYDRVIADGGTFEGLLGYESAVTISKSN